MAGGLREAKRTAARERILEAASRAIRNDGPDGVSVARIMAEAGLTHGAFYSYFDSKDALVAAALETAGEGFRARLAEAAGGGTAAERLLKMGAAYLSLEHRADPSSGCQIASLGPELARSGGPVAQSYEDGVKRVLSLVEELMDEAYGKNPDNAQNAAATLAMVVGGMVLSRSMRREADAEAILSACRAALERLVDRSPPDPSEND